MTVGISFFFLFFAGSCCVSGGFFDPASSAGVCFLFHDAGVGPVIHFMETEDLLKKFVIS